MEQVVAVLIAGEGGSGRRAPVELGDVLALADGSPCRVVTLVDVDVSDALDAPCQVEPA